MNAIWERSAEQKSRHLKLTEDVAGSDGATFGGTGRDEEWIDQLDKRFPRQLRRAPVPELNPEKPVPFLTWRRNINGDPLPVGIVGCGQMWCWQLAEGRR